MKHSYPFTEDQFRAAADEWGANCGPSALAFALAIPLPKVREAIPDFEERGYTSPTMMRAALANLCCAVDVVRKPDRCDMFDEQIALTRIQWTGPWTRPKPQRWAARHTHWIATWLDCGQPHVFDCNGGVRSMQSWDDEIAPLLIQSHKNCDGWEPANVWRLTPVQKPRTPLDAMIDQACGVRE